MIVLPEIDPVAIEIGPLKLHWYGIAYLIGMLGAIGLGQLRARKPHSPIPRDRVIDLVLYASIGAILGGRLGYSFFYQFSHYFFSPLDILKLWEGGMSFHGGLVGSILGVWVYGRKQQIFFLRLTDFLAPFCAVGLFFGRIANFINQELWGRLTDVPWAVVFPNDPQQLTRHPSQLYEAALEGLLLFVILWTYSARPRAIGAVSGLFLIGYGVFRCAIEFVRQPDVDPGFVISDWGTMGQVLSVPVIIAGVTIWLLSRRDAFSSPHA